jgi:hypothetical protein
MEMTQIANTKSTSNELSAASFAALRHGEVIAIVLDDVASAEECDRACRGLRILTEKTTYRWSSDLRVLGVSVGEAHEGTEALERYLEGSEQIVAMTRNLVFAGVTPVDRIAHHILRIWQPGLRIPFLNERPFLSQILRRWKTGGGAHPHLDQTRTTLLRPFAMENRFGLNVYVGMPTKGGAVEFWNRSMTDEEYVGLKRPDYGLNRDVLGPPDLAIRPRRGQAILFDAFKPHAVEAVAGEGERVTNACFFGFAGEDKPLFQFA